MVCAQPSTRRESDGAHSFACAGPRAAVAFVQSVPARAGVGVAMLAQPHSGFTRIPYTQLCRLTRGDRPMDGLVCNISVLGVYVTLDPVPEVGETVALSFALPGGGPRVQARG